MNIAQARAKTLILAWFDKGKPDARQRKKFATNIDVFFETLAHRAEWCECLSTLLDDKGVADFSISTRSWRATPSGKGLVVSSIVPGWNFGWRNVLNDDISDDVQSWLGHYARQYIHRSNIAKVLMAAWERHSIVLHPFGTGLKIQRYSDFRPKPSNRRVFALAEADWKDDWGSYPGKYKKYRSKWVNRNTLDPAIHQGIFHFQRAQSLVSAGFELEALAAFDCVLQSVQKFDWSWAPNNPGQDRRDLIRNAGLGKRAEELAEHLYFLRNQFVAHAGGWRWWDAMEYLEGELVGDVGGLASRTLRKVADLEPAHRRLEPSPDDWAIWLENNFPLIWSSIWFRDP